MNAKFQDRCCGRWSPVAVMAIGALIVPAAAGCEEVPATYGDGGPDAAVGDAMVRDAGPLDGASDARPPVPDGTVYDVCDQALFKLPIDGMTEITRGVDLWGGKVVYSKYFDQAPDEMHVYFFDTPSCVGFKLTRGGGTRAAAPSIWGNLITWSDGRGATNEPYLCNQIYSYDLSMWAELPITDSSVCKRQPKTNGRYIAYTRNVEEQHLSAADFRLRDLETDQEIVLAPASGQVGYFDISDRYVVWSQYRGVTNSTGRDIVYYDLQTQQMGWVEQSAQHYTYAVFTSENHLTYLASDNYAMPPWSLHLVNLKTGDATVLSDDDDAMPYGYISDNLVTFVTAQYRNPSEAGLVDGVIYDIRSGMSRRLTNRSSTMGVGQIAFPYMLVGQWLAISRSNHSDYYIADLVKLGVTDLQGNLIPGEPVLDPPP